MKKRDSSPKSQTRAVKTKHTEERVTIRNWIWETRLVGYCMPEQRG